MKSLSKVIAGIPGSEGWYKSSGEEIFRSLGEDLIKKGKFTLDEVDSFLSRAYSAVSGEYGE